MSNTEKTPPKIEFPCENYPIKVVGECSEGYRQEVLNVVSLHAPGFDINQITERESNKGRFKSITIYITATGVEQLETLHKALVDMPTTRLVL